MVIFEDNDEKAGCSANAPYSPEMFVVIGFR